MTSYFPKFQLSRFHANGNGKILQSVFRTDDKQEYEDQLKSWIEAITIDETLKEATPTTSPAPVDFGVCKKNASHGNMIMGRNGKPYCKPCYIEWKNSQEKTY